MLAAAAVPRAQSPSAPVHARGVKRLLISGAMAIRGPGTPAYGPADTLIEDGIPYSVEALMQDVKEMVAKARKQQARGGMLYLVV